MTRLPDGVTVRLATAADVRELCDRMRPDDLAELHALGHPGDPFEHLMKDVGESAGGYAFFIHGSLAAVAGVEPPNEGHPTACIWMLSTDTVDRNRRLFIEASRIVIDEALRHFPVLGNMVHSRYTRAIRWLRNEGAEFGEPFEVDSGELFVPFAIFREYSDV